MLKKTCLAAFSLSLFVPLANATAYTDKVAEMQAKYELAVKGDKAAAAYVCRQGNLPQLKVRLIDRDKHAQACRQYAQNIASDPQVYRWFMEWSMHLPHVVDVRGRGLMIGVELDVPYKEIRSKLLFEEHCFTGCSGTNVLRLLPPLCLSEAEAADFLSRLERVVKE